mgnify:FL=1
MKSHPHRGTRLLAWRLLRKWYGLYGPTGEDLREQWVWKGEAGTVEEGALAPMPPHPAEYREDYEREFGAFEGAPEGEDLCAAWNEELVGEARWVEGGVEVVVRERAVDVWVLSAMEDKRDRDERANLWKVNTIPRSWMTDEEQQALASHSLGEMDDSELSSTVVNIQGVLLFREGFLPSPSRALTSPTPSLSGPSPEPFVATPSTSLLLHSLALHLRLRLPTLLSSPPSSGKSSTLTHLWSLLHSLPSSTLPTPQSRQRNLVIINLADRSLDSKSLLGSLSSAPATADTEAGTFAFVEGPLTRAVRQGRWVVLTSIDQASMEVLSVIKVVAERMKRASEAAVGAAWGGGAGEEGGGVGVRVGGGEGRWVKAGKGFMLFATRSTESRSEPAFFASGFWSDVWMDRPKREEVGMIVRGRYPRLEKAGLRERLIGVWERVREAGGKDAGAGTVRSIGVRDLMRCVFLR